MKIEKHDHVFIDDGLKYKIYKIVDRIVYIKRCKLNLIFLVNKKYGSTFIYKSNKWIRCKKRKPKLEINFDAELEGSNNNIFYDTNSQNLAEEKIIELKKQNRDNPYDVIQKLIEHSTSFEQKTEISKFKYIEKKMKRHLNQFTVYECNTINLINYFYKFYPEKVCYIRVDYLANILFHVNKNFSIKSPKSEKEDKLAEENKEKEAENKEKEAENKEKENENKEKEAENKEKENENRENEIRENGIRENEIRENEIREKEKTEENTQSCLENGKNEDQEKRYNPTEKLQFCDQQEKQEIQETHEKQNIIIYDDSCGLLTAVLSICFNCHVNIYSLIHKNCSASLVPFFGIKQSINFLNINILSFDETTYKQNKIYLNEKIEFIIPSKRNCEFSEKNKKNCVNDNKNTNDEINKNPFTTTINANANGTSTVDTSIHSSVHSLVSMDDMPNKDRERFEHTESKRGINAIDENGGENKRRKTDEKDLEKDFEKEIEKEKEKQKEKEIEIEIEKDTGNKNEKKKVKEDNFETQHPLCENLENENKNKLDGEGEGERKEGEGKESNIQKNKTGNFSELIELQQNMLNEIYEKKAESFVIILSSNFLYESKTNVHLLLETLIRVALKYLRNDSKFIFYADDFVLSNILLNLLHTTNSFINIKLNEYILREQQVVKRRTHPIIKQAKLAEGFLITAIKVAS